MIYVRAGIEPETNRFAYVHCTQEPLRGALPAPTWCEPLHVCIGAWPDEVVPVGASPAAFFRDRLRYDPETSVVVVRDEFASTLAAPLQTPTTLDGIRTHLATYGRQHALPAVVVADVIEHICDREETRMTELYNLGMSTAEIRKLPRYKAIREAQTRARAEALIAEQAAAKALRRESIQAARIARRLGQPSEPTP